MGFLRVSVVAPEVACPPALRSVAVAWNLILLLTFRTFRFFLESFQLTLTIPSAGTLKSLAPRLIHLRAPTPTFDADRRPIVPVSPFSALKL